jgi:fatty acid desaturase
MDTAVNRHQSQSADTSATADATTLDQRQLADLSRDDASAGCMMGIALVLIVLFGLLMAGATLYFTMMTPTASLPSVK